MGRNLAVFVVAIATATALASAPAEAATHCVNPAGSGSCFASINAAVNSTAVGPGDTISIGPGVYNEAVTIPAGRDGLRLIGPAAIVDPEIRAANTSSVGLTIHSRDVSVLGLTVRNGKSDGIRVDAGGLELTGVKVLGAAGIGVDLMPGADGAAIKGCRFEGLRNGVIIGDSLTGVGNVTVTGSVFARLGSTGVGGQGDDVTLSSNQFADIFFAGVFLTAGNRPSLRSNIFTNITLAAVVLGSPAAPLQNAVVSLNRIRNAGANNVGCIEVYGPYASVTSNSLVGCDAGNSTASWAAMYLKGASPTVARNLISSVESTGIWVDTGSDGAAVTSNRVSAGIVEGLAAVEVFGNDTTVSNNVVNEGSIEVDGNGPTVIANSVSDARGGYGLHMRFEGGSGGTVARNRVTGSDLGGLIGITGSGTGADSVSVDGNAAGGFQIFGTNLTVSRNQAVGAGIGFFVTGSADTLIGNTARNTGSDGYQLLGPGPFVLTDNTADHCDEDGFDIHTTTGAVLSGNRATSNLGAGFEVDASSSGVQLTGANVSTGNAISACFGGNGASTSLSGVNAIGTPDAPAACDFASGYVGN